MGFKKQTTINMISLERWYFNMWRTAVSIRNYNRWCEIQNEQFNEEEYARQNNMDPRYWCWNCKYSDCDVHG